MKHKQLLTLTWKRLGLIVLGEVVAIILHNLVSALLGVEEPIFFILAVFVLPVYLLVSLFSTLLNLVIKKKK